MEADARPDGRQEKLTDTIFALSSGAPPAGVALIRISGPRADAVLSALAGRLPEPRVATFRRLRHEGEAIDNTVIIRFPGPDSATGEDIAELHLHGGRAVVARVLAILGGMEGLRAAEPGEFTRRGFENGRMDLAEAEGLGDLLLAETESQRRAALALLGGVLSRQVGDWQAHLLALSAEIEAAIDFSDEGDIAAPDIAAPLATLTDEIRDCLARPPAERLRDGIRVVIAGPPNAGKSTLLNALAGREAAIAHEQAGTTRDVIEAPVALGGTPFVLVDTAGLRESEEAVEAMGVERARLQVEAADMVLWLGTAEEAPLGAIRIAAKADLGASDPKAELSVSALRGEGMDALVAMLREQAALLLPSEGEVAINARHRAVLADVLARLEEAASADPLIVAESLRQARAALDRITGRAGVEHMLDALFGRFCIGK